MEVIVKRPERIADKVDGRDAARPAADANGDAIAALINARPLRILLADDSYDNRMLIETYLKEDPACGRSCRGRCDRGREGQGEPL